MLALVVARKNEMRAMFTSPRSGANSDLPASVVNGADLPVPTRIEMVVS